MAFLRGTKPDLLLRGIYKKGFDYQETFTPVAKKTTVQVVRSRGSIKRELSLPADCMSLYMAYIWPQDNAI